MNDEGALLPHGSRARTLLVRCWFERSGGGFPALRGTLRDLAGGEHRTFDGFDGLVLMLRRALLGALPGASVPPDGELP